MNANTLSIKPVFWRLLIWRFIPAYVGGFLGMLLVERSFVFSTFFWLALVFAILIGILIGHFVFRLNHDLEVSIDTITGLGSDFFFSRETFPLAELDKSSLYKQTFYERISGFRTIHSVSGKKIMLIPFIYGKPAVEELYKILEK